MAKLQTNPTTRTREIILRYHQGEKQGDISRALKCSPATVSETLSSPLVQLELDRLNKLALDKYVNRRIEMALEVREVMLPLAEDIKEGQVMVHKGLTPPKIAETQNESFKTFIEFFDYPLTENQTYIQANQQVNNYIGEEEHYALSNAPSYDHIAI